MTTCATDGPPLASARPGEVAGVGRDWLHKHTGEAIDLARDGVVVEVLEMRARRAVPTGVVLVRLDDAAAWVRRAIGDGAERRPAALTVAEAAELAAVSPSAIRQRMLRDRRNGDGSHE